MRMRCPARDQHRRRLRARHRRRCTACIRPAAADRPHAETPAAGNWRSSASFSPPSRSSKPAMRRRGGGRPRAWSWPASPRRRRASTRWIVLRSPPKVPVPGETSLARIQSQPFAARLARALATMSSVSAAKPMTKRRPVVGAPGDSVARMSGFSARRSSGGPLAVFFQLVPGDALRPASRRPRRP